MVDHPNVPGSHDPVRNDPHLRGGKSPDYSEPETARAKAGATHERMPGKGSKWAKIGAGLLVVLVVGLLVSRMPFLAGSLNAGAPVDEVVTSSVDTEVGDPVEGEFLLGDEDMEVRPADGIGQDDDASSVMPTPDMLTPSNPPATE